MGNVIGNFVYDGRDSRDFGVIVSSLGTHHAPQRVVEEIVIPGRNGTLTIDNGRFENIKLSYIGMILHDFANNFDEFKAFMLSRKGYKRLEDSFSPDYFRLAKIHDEITPSVVTWDAAGKFEIPFDCDPRRFLKIGENEIELVNSALNGTYIYNPTMFESKPFLRAWGTGDITISNNGLLKKISISTNSTYVDIDLETYNAYNGSTNMNDKVSIPDDAALGIGQNFVYTNGSITKLIIIPRWWTI